VWVSAASQIFYSLGIGWGTLPVFASYNHHHHNFIRDAWVVPLINCGTSFLAGLVVFAVLGNMSVSSGISIDEMEIEGSGLAFVVYPAAIATLPAAPVFAFLFFLMLLCLGLDSQFSMVSVGCVGGLRLGSVGGCVWALWGGCVWGGGGAGWFDETGGRARVTGRGGEGRGGEGLLAAVSECVALVS
jgi:hypothetical protein